RRASHLGTADRWHRRWQSNPLRAPLVSAQWLRSLRQPLPELPAPEPRIRMAFPGLLAERVCQQPSGPPVDVKPCGGLPPPHGWLDRFCRYFLTGSTTTAAGASGWVGSAPFCLTSIGALAPRPGTVFTRSCSLMPVMASITGGTCAIMLVTSPVILLA